VRRVAASVAPEELIGEEIADKAKVGCPVSKLPKAKIILG
jgi:hypothetical protein